MNIIFQSGVFINEPNIWATYGASIATLLGVLITGIIAIYLFNIGIKKDRELANEQRKLDYDYNRELEKQRREEEKRLIQEKRLTQLNNFGKLYIVYLDHCIKTSKDQAEEYLKFATEFKTDLLNKHFPYNYPYEYLDRLLMLKHELILDFYEHKKVANEDFISTLSQLDYLKTIFSTLPRDIHEENGKFVISLTNDLIKIRDEILYHSNAYMIIQRKDRPDYAKDQLYILLNKIIIDYTKGDDGKYNLSWDYEKLIKPIIQNLNEEPLVFQPICYELLISAKKGSDIIFTIKQYNSQICEDILKVIENLNTSIEKLEEIRGKLV